MLCEDEASSLCIDHIKITFMTTIKILQVALVIIRVERLFGLYKHNKSELMLGLETHVFELLSSFNKTLFRFIKFIDVNRFCNAGIKGQM